MDGAVAQKALFSCTGVGVCDLVEAIQEFFRRFDRPVLSVFDTECGSLYISTDPSRAQEAHWHEICDRRIIGDAIDMTVVWYLGLSPDRRRKLASGDHVDGRSPKGWQIQELPHDSPEHRWARITPAWV